EFDGKHDELVRAAQRLDHAQVAASDRVRRGDFVIKDGDPHGHRVYGYIGHESGRVNPVLRALRVMPTRAFLPILPMPEDGKNDRFFAKSSRVAGTRREGLAYPLQNMIVIGLFRLTQAAQNGYFARLQSQTRASPAQGSAGQSEV